MATEHEFTTDFKARLDELQSEFPSYPLAPAVCTSCGYETLYRDGCIKCGYVAEEDLA